jgi:hypothetical protein
VPSGSELLQFGIAVVLPPAGAIIGLLQVLDGERNLGLRLIVVALLAATVWVWLLTGL